MTLDVKFRLFSLSEAVEHGLPAHVRRSFCSVRRGVDMCISVSTQEMRSFILQRYIDQSIDLCEIMSLLIYFKASQGHELMAPAVLLYIPASSFQCSSQFLLPFVSRPPTLKCRLFLSLSLSLNSPSANSN